MRHFSDLSDYDFVLLARQLLKAESGIELTTPPDGSRHLSGDSARGTVIVICQHRRDNSPAGVESGLRTELSRLRSLPRAHCVLATTAELEGSQKAQLGQLLEAEGELSATVLAAADLDAMLDRHPSIERASTKLWLTRDTIPDLLAGSPSTPRRAALAAKMRDTIRIFVPSPALEEGRSALRRESCCIIEGSAGIGKTTLAYMLAAEAIIEGYEPIFVSSDVDEALSTIEDSDGRYVVVYDDFLGQSTTAELLGKNEDARLAELVQIATETRKVRLIATTRDYVLKHARRKYARLDEIIRRDRSIVMSVNDLDPLFRAHVLYNHLYYSSLPPSVLNSFRSTGKVRKVIEHVNYNPRLVAGFPSLPTATDPDVDGPTLLLNYLNNPVRLWESVLAQLPPECGDILNVLFTLPDGIDVNDVAICTRNLRRQKGQNLETDDFLEALRALEPTFIRIDGSVNNETDRSFASFRDPSIRDFAFSRISRLLSENLTDLLSSLEFWEQTAMLSELAFADSRERAGISRSLWGLSRALSENISHSLAGFGDSDELAQAISRTMFSRPARARHSWISKNSDARITSLLKWPPALRSKVMMLDPNLREKVSGSLMALAKEERYLSVRRIMDIVEGTAAEAGQAGAVLVEPALRRVAIELIDTASASVAAWGQGGVNTTDGVLQTAGKLETAARIDRLVGTGDETRSRIKTESRIACAQLVAHLEAVLGYSLAVLKLAREKRQSGPDQPDQDLEAGRRRGPDWIDRRVSRRARGSRGLDGLALSALDAEIPGFSNVSYFPEPRALGLIIRSIQSLRTICDDDDFPGVNETISLASAILQVGDMLERLSDSRLSGGGPPRGGSVIPVRTKTNELEEKIAEIFGTLGTDS